ncbi:archease [Nonomuraea sediminis]|uniref:archease n=1 Tax=Nonomuraea sediminis TaxID=2835864 RepID=UPI001BDCD12B|nr:archease [Nonomuraea sediminis]
MNPVTEPSHRVRIDEGRLVLDAWAPGRGECVAEALHALTAGVRCSGADVLGEQITESLEAEPDADLLAEALDLAIERMAAYGQVPADIEVAEHPDGTTTLVMLMVTHAWLRYLPTASPEADDVVLARAGGGWCCHAVVDVQPTTEEAR